MEKANPNPNNPNFRLLERGYAQCTGIYSVTLKNAHALKIRVLKQQIHNGRRPP